MPVWTQLNQRTLVPEDPNVCRAPLARTLHPKLKGGEFKRGVSRKHKKQYRRQQERETKMTTEIKAWALLVILGLLEIIYIAYCVRESRKTNREEQKRLAHSLMGYMYEEQKREREYSSKQNPVNLPHKRLKSPQTNNYTANERKANCERAQTAKTRNNASTCEKGNKNE